MEHRRCVDCLHYDACRYGVLSTKDTDSVNAEYCKAFKDRDLFSIPPCGVGDTLYRRWTCGGRETVAQFTVTRISKSGGEWEIEFQSAHSSKWSRPVVRHCKEPDIGKKIFLSAEKASKEKSV